MNGWRVKSSGCMIFMAADFVAYLPASVKPDLPWWLPLPCVTLLSVRVAILNPHATTSCRGSVIIIIIVIMVVIK